MQLVIFVLVVFGMVEIIIKGKPTKPIRNFFSKVDVGKEFIHCPLCIGFWAGIFCGYFLMPFYAHWALCGFFNGCIGAGTAYFLHTWIAPPEFEMGGDEDE